MSVTIVKKRLSERLREKQAEMKKLYHRGYSDIQSLLIEAAEELEKIEKSTSYILTPIGEGAYGAYGEAPKESEYEYFVMDCSDPFHSKFDNQQICGRCKQSWKYSTTRLTSPTVASPNVITAGSPLRNGGTLTNAPTVQ